MRSFIATSRPTLMRLRAVTGMPSGLMLGGFLVSQSLVNVVFDLLPNRWFEMLWLVGCLALALVGFRRWDRSFATALTDSAASVGQSGAAKLATRRGLVILLGLDSDRPDSPVVKLLAASPAVEFIALVGTPQTQERKVAPAITSRLLPAAGRTVPASQIRVWEQGNNAESVADFEQTTREAIAWMIRRGLDLSEIVVDVSEGRRPMGFGAQAAANAAGVETQYLASAWDHVGNRPMPHTQIFKLIQELHPSPELVA